MLTLVDAPLRNWHRLYRPPFELSSLVYIGTATPWDQGPRAISREVSFFPPVVLGLFINRTL